MWHYNDSDTFDYDNDLVAFKWQHSDESATRADGDSSSVWCMDKQDLGTNTETEIDWSIYVEESEDDDDDDDSDEDEDEDAATGVVVSMAAVALLSASL